MSGTIPAPTNWNYADVWELIAEHQPHALALTHGERQLEWAEFDRQADGIAQWLLGLGLARPAIVALCLRNRPEYLIATFGCLKVAAVPANTNVRYTTDELYELWQRADVRAVVYDATTAAAVEPLLGLMPEVRGWLHVSAPGAAAADERADSWDEVAARGVPGRGRTAPPGRSADDPYVLFTGGTTGTPKGVLWRQDDLFALLNRTVQAPWDDAAGLAGVGAALAAGAARPPRLVVAAPLMHGLGALTAISALASAGTVTTLTQPSYCAAELLDTIQARSATQATIVGDAMARPLLRAVEEQPTRWSLESLRVLLSSGTAWTASTKQALAARFPKARCVDVLGATEAIGVASAVARDGSAGRFVLGPHASVVDAQLRPVVAGSSVPGRVVVRGRVPLGYLGDHAASAATFFEADGARWTLLGDWATVESDGSVRLLGRGSSVINTGGEKVFPDEVEQALRACPGVADAAVVGVEDARLGQQVVALVVAAASPGSAPLDVASPSLSSAPLDVAALREGLRTHLAGFKLPRAVHVVESLGRGADGKLDRPALERRAAELTAEAARPATARPAVERGVELHAG